MSIVRVQLGGQTVQVQVLSSGFARANEAVSEAAASAAAAAASAAAASATLATAALKANNLSDLTSASTARANLGLGSIATQSASAVAITGGAIAGITDLAVVDGGTGASDASGARTNLGLAIGTNVQAYDADLTAIAALTSAADKMPYSTGPQTWALADLTSFARTLLATASNSAFLAALGQIASTAINFLQAGTGATTRTGQDKLRDTLDVRDFGVTTSGDKGAEIQAALTEAASSGKELVWPGGSYTSNQALSCGAVKMRAQGPVTITYGSSTHIGRFVEISAAGAGDVVFAGDFTFDGNNKANIGVTIINENATARKLSIGNLTGRNCKMVTGSAFNAGSIGVNILGNWSLIQANRLAASAINRDAGTAGGTLSTIGVQAGNTAGYAPLVIDVDILDVSSISCGDIAGAAQRIDVDGAFFAQLDVTGASCRVGQLLATDCVGRSYKNQSYRSNVLEAASITRSVQGITGGSADIDFQFATGVLGQADFYYSGSANLGDGVTPVSYFTATVRSRYGPVETGPITVVDSTGGAETLNQVLSCRNSSGTSVALLYDLGPVTVVGKAVKCVVDVGASGSVGVCQINFGGFSGALTYSVIKNNASPSFLTASYRNVRNTGSEVPTIKRDDAASLGNFYGRHWDVGGNIGLTVNRGADAGPPGIASLSSTVTGASVVSGFAPIFAGTLAAGATTTLPPFGLIASAGIVTISVIELGVIGQYQCTGSSNTINTIAATGTIVVGSGGADPGSGDIRGWITSGGTRLAIKNATASDRAINVYAFM